MRLKPQFLRWWDKNPQMMLSALGPGALLIPGQQQFELSAAMPRSSRDAGCASILAHRMAGKKRWTYAGLSTA